MHDLLLFDLVLILGNASKDGTGSELAEICETRERGEEW